MRKYNIPIFVPHKGCPFDCVFCDQNRITGIESADDVTPDTVTETIERYLKTIPEQNDGVETAFFGGSFTGIPIEEQSALMARVRPYMESGRIDGIRLSTRPDYISREILDNLERHRVTTIELGVQSMIDSVLKAANRGHTARQVEDAVSLIRKYDFRLGLQMMTGLPGDTEEYSVETARRIIALKPDCVRIYPTLTIRGTYLEKLWREGRYVPQTVDEAARLCARLIIMFEAAGIDVIRVGLQPTDEINRGAAVAAGPFHSAFGELAESAIYYDIAAKELLGCGGKSVIFYVNPREISKLVGNRRANIERLEKEFNVKLKIKGDSALKKREVRRVCC